MVAVLWILEPFSRNVFYEIISKFSLFGCGPRAFAAILRSLLAGSIFPSLSPLALFVCQQTIRFHGACERTQQLAIKKLGFIMASFTFQTSLKEVAQEYLHNAFLLAQRPLTDAVTAIFKKTFGALEWSSNLKAYLGPSMKDFVVDDGRAFDMCVRSPRCIVFMMYRFTIAHSLSLPPDPQLFVDRRTSKEYL